MFTSINEFKIYLKENFKDNLLTTFKDEEILKILENFKNKQNFHFDYSIISDVELKLEFENKFVLDNIPDSSIPLDGEGKCDFFVTLSINDNELYIKSETYHFLGEMFTYEKTDDTNYTAKVDTPFDEINETIQGPENNYYGVGFEAFTDFMLNGIFDIRNYKVLDTEHKYLKFLN